MKVLRLVQDEKTTEIYLSVQFNDGAVIEQRFSDLSTMKSWAFDTPPATHEDAMRKVCRLIVDGTITFEEVAAKEGIEIDYKAAEATEKTK